MLQQNNQSTGNSFIPAIQQLNDYLFKLLPVLKDMKEEQTTKELVGKYTPLFKNVKSVDEFIQVYTQYAVEAASLNNSTAVKYFAPMAEVQLGKFNEEERYRREDEKYQKDIERKEKEIKDVLPVFEAASANKMVYINGQLIRVGDVLNTEQYQQLSPLSKEKLLNFYHNYTVKEQISLSPDNKNVIVNYTDPDSKIVKSDSYPLNDKDFSYMVGDKKYYLPADAIREYRVNKELIEGNAKSKVENVKEGTYKSTTAGVYEIRNVNTGEKENITIVQSFKDGRIHYNYTKTKENKPTPLTEDELKSYNQEDIVKAKKDLLNKSEIKPLKPAQVQAEIGRELGTIKEKTMDSLKDTKMKVILGNESKDVTAFAYLFSFNVGDITSRVNMIIQQLKEKGKNENKNYEDEINDLQVFLNRIKPYIDRLSNSETNDDTNIWDDGGEE
jgi:hypothetical protein